MGGWRECILAFLEKGSRRVHDLNVRRDGAWSTGRGGEGRGARGRGRENAVFIVDGCTTASQGGGGGALTTVDEEVHTGRSSPCFKGD